jgi:hypothetical protein
MPESGELVIMIAMAVNTAGLNLGEARLAIADRSRRQLESQAPVRFYEVNVRRTARSVYGYPDSNPFLRDLLEGVRRQAPDAVWLGYVHADIVFTPRFCSWLQQHQQHGHQVLTACRLNVRRGDSLEAVQATGAADDPGMGQTVGVELLLVHRQGFEQFLSQLPDVVVGVDAWGQTARAAARGLKLYACDCPAETPLRHISHPHHPGTADSLVRGLNHLMLQAASRRV